MKDYLQDIVQHTFGLGVIEIVKVVGDQNETTLEAMDTVSRTLVVQAKFKNPVPEFVGTFGMPNLGKLNTVLNIPEYKDGATITVKTKTNQDGTAEPDGIRFENKTSDFKNDYRLMSSTTVLEVVKKTKFSGAKWNVTFSPSAVAIQRLKFQSQANSEETTFIAKTDNGALKFFFGDHSSHAGDFVFESSVQGTISRSLNWPLPVVISILNLPGDKIIKISDDGVMLISVDSGIADYNYYVLAQTK